MTRLRGPSRPSAATDQDFLAVFFAGAFLAVVFLVAVVFFAAVDVAAVVFFAAVVLAAVDFDAVFLAGADFVAVFLAGADFVAVVFFAAVDFAAVDFDAVFLAGADFVAVFLAAVDFVAVVFFAAVDLEAVDFAAPVAAPVTAAAAARTLAGGFGIVAAVSLGSFFAPEITSLSSLPAENFGTAFFFDFIRSPVCGLRTQRALRTAFSNEPNPVMATFSPLATSRVMVSSTDSSAWAACLRFPS